MRIQTYDALNKLFMDEDEWTSITLLHKLQIVSCRYHQISVN